MIGKIYMGYDKVCTVNGKKYKTKVSPVKCYGNDPWEIEGYEDAVSSDKLYICHHVLEWKYSVEELKNMNRYENVPSSELIWIEESIHRGNRFIHKCWDNKISESMKGRVLTEEHKNNLKKAKHSGGEQ